MCAEGRIAELQLIMDQGKFRPPQQPEEEEFLEEEQQDEEMPMQHDAHQHEPAPQQQRAVPNDTREQLRLIHEQLVAFVASQ